MFDDKANDLKEKEYQNVTNMEMEESGNKGMFAFLKLYPLEITLYMIIFLQIFLTKFISQNTSEIHHYTFLAISLQMSMFCIFLK